MEPQHYEELDARASRAGPTMSMSTTSILLLVNSFAIILGQTRVDIY